MSKTTSCIRMSTLYKLTAPNGKSYIGISKKPTESRWKKHQEHARGKRVAGVIYSAIRKYGADNFRVETLVVADDWNYLCDLERKAICVFGTKTPHGYNVTDGGEGTIGRLVSDEQRKNMSSAQRKRFERPEERAKALTASQKGRDASKKKWATLRVDGMPRWERELYASRTHIGTPEHSAMVSQTTKSGMRRPEVREKVIRAARERALNPEWRAKISKAKIGCRKGIKPSAEVIERRRAGILAAWADPEKRAARIAKNKAARQRR